MTQPKTRSGPLVDQVALITGAGSGLGKQIATQLLKAGAKVAVLGRNLDKLVILRDKFGADVLPLQGDIAKSADVTAAFQAIDQRFGTVDILINNAAIYEPFKIDEATDEQLQSILNINVLGTAYCMREAVKRMRPKGSGDIINVTSESTRNPFPYLSMYAASKCAVEGLSIGQRAELAADGIRVMILRSGSMVGEDASANADIWTEQQLSDAMAAWGRTGHIAFTGSGMNPATVATAALNALSLPREATTDIIEVRSAR